jgi:hypothetical protein
MKNTMVISILTFDPSKGGKSEKRGPKFEIFKIEIFQKQNMFSYSVLSQDSKNVICLSVRSLEVPKIFK